MRRTLSLPVITLIAFTSISAMAQVVLTDFESYTTPSGNGAVLFRQPSFSGSTAGKLDTSIYNNSIVESTGVPAGNPNAGLNSLHAAFDFNDTGATPLWLRFTTYNTSVLPNPTIGLWPGWGLQFDIYSDTPLYVTTLVRETESGAALGANGGATGGIEFVGGNPTATSGRGHAVAANSWTTVTFDFSSEAVAAFAGAANGVLDPGADGRGVLDALGIATDNNNVGPINLWIDNIQMVVPEPSSIALSLLGGFAFLIRRMRRK